jgi:hypothetical protein
MMINGVRYLWASLSFSNPDKTTGGSIMVAYPEHDPKASPVFLIDNNGENPFASISYANWLPAPSVHFVDPVKGQPVTWDGPEPLHACQQNGCESVMTREYLLEVPDGFIKVWLCQTDATSKNNLKEVK